MPELPEVEAARRAIEEHCAGKKVRHCSVADDSKVIDGVSPSDFQSALVGKTIVAALRKGKNLWLRLDSPPFPSFQFGMSGAVYIKGVAVTKYKRSAVSDKDEWPSKYSKVFMELEDGLELSFTDKRRFAKVRLLQDAFILTFFSQRSILIFAPANPFLQPETMPPISVLGPDALLELLHIDEFVNALRKKKIAIKALLLDQSFISGIGNWIADEVLYQARIHPLQIASSLSRENCESLHQCIKEVIEKAVEVGADSNQYPSNWIFHSREKKPGKAFVDGKRIEFITAGGRTSAFVPELQKLNGVESDKAQSSRSKKAKPADEVGEADEMEEENKRPLSKKGKNKNTGSRRQQKKTDDSDGVEADVQEERPKREIGKKPLPAGKMQGKVVKEVSIKDEQKPANGRAKTTKETLKKRSESREASTQQKKKTRK